METYRIIPLGGAYRVEAVQQNGQKWVVRTWPTEEAAVSHLKALREIAERVDSTLHPGEKDWRGCEPAPMTSVVLLRMMSGAPWLIVG